LRIVHPFLDGLYHPLAGIQGAGSQHFQDWGLTASDRDVALFAIKGLSISEIAEMRETREGTIKAQCNAIYRKAGVTGRPQLISLFVEELMGADMTTRHAGA
jgi:DNA-binding CsgD family transcriptional regulator